MSQFASKVLLLSVCLVLCTVDVAGLQCLECEEVYNPVDCSLVGTCGRDEVCFTRRFINFRGQTAYRMGCEEKYICDQTLSHVIVGRDVIEAICRQCCEENYCNSMLCRESLIISSTVPKISPNLTRVQTTSTPVMHDCGDNSGKDGVYKINPDGLSPFNVYCGLRGEFGWNVIQRRFDGSVSFTQNWESYKKGFGSLDGEFWLGNEYVHRLTSVPDKHYTLWFDLTAENGAFFTAHYNNFTVGAESEGYRVNFTTYHGTAGDLFKYHRNMPFSTPDRDTRHGYNDCGKRYKAGWWYDNCYHTNINGVYGIRNQTGMMWYDVTGWTRPLIATAMAISAEE